MLNAARTHESRTELGAHARETLLRFFMPRPSRFLAELWTPASNRRVIHHQKAEFEHLGWITLVVNEQLVSVAVAIGEAGFIFSALSKDPQDYANDPYDCLTLIRYWNSKRVFWDLVTCKRAFDHVTIPRRLRVFMRPGIPARVAYDG